MHLAAAAGGRGEVEVIPVHATPFRSLQHPAVLYSNSRQRKHFIDLFSIQLLAKEVFLHIFCWLKSFTFLITRFLHLGNCKSLRFCGCSSHRQDPQPAHLSSHSHIPYFHFPQLLFAASLACLCKYIQIRVGHVIISGITFHFFDGTLNCLTNKPT